MRRSIIVAVMLSSTRSAWPQQANAEAEALFRQGRELMASGKVGEACAAFDASQKLDPAPATMLNGAACREKNHQLATAWAMFVEAERTTRAATDDASQQMHATAQTRAAQLEARLSTLRVDVPDEVAIPGLQILRNGVVMEPGAWNKALPIDGGTYTVAARAPGTTDWSSTIVIGVERDTKTITIPRLAETQATSAESSGATRVGGDLWTIRRKIAVGVASGGVVALATGTIVGVMAKRAQSDAHALCPDQQIDCANADRANALVASGHARAITADVMFGVGAAAIIAAGVMWVTGTPSSSDDVAIVPSTSSGTLVLSIARSL